MLFYKDFEMKMFGLIICLLLGSLNSANAQIDRTITPIGNVYQTTTGDMIFVGLDVKNAYFIWTLGKETLEARHGVTIREAKKVGLKPYGECTLQVTSGGVTKISPTREKMLFGQVDTSYVNMFLAPGNFAPIPSRAYPFSYVLLCHYTVEFADGTTAEWAYDYATGSSYAWPNNITPGGTGTGD